MYGIFTNICPKNHPNVGKYTIHGAYGWTFVPITSITDILDGLHQATRAGQHGCREVPGIRLRKLQVSSRVLRHAQQQATLTEGRWDDHQML